jgi:hypothetical protein
MGQFAHYDTDDERLPEGMQRIGYDADTETYTYRDADGNIWEGPPGNPYGHLTKISGPAAPAADGYEADQDDEAELEAPPPYRPNGQSSWRADSYNPLTVNNASSYARHSWRADMMPLLNFGMLIGLFLLVLFWIFHMQAAGEVRSTCETGSKSHMIQAGDTCWALAETHHISLERLRALNPHVECDGLVPGKTLCVPTD